MIASVPQGPECAGSDPLSAPRLPRPPTRRPNGHMTATRLEACPQCGQLRTAPPPPPYSAPPPPPPPPPVTSYAASYPAPAPPPPTSPNPAGGLSAASVPKILLGLGATCLLVAAVIFLAVAWSSLGIGGRTAVLIGLTVAAALAGQWLSRRDLGVGAEALTTVALGMVVVDLFGARHALWIDVPADHSFLVLLGGVLLTVSLVLCASATRLIAPQVSAPLGLGLAVLGIGATTEHLQLLATVAVLAFTALAALAGVARLRVLPWSAGAGAVLSYLVLLGLAALDASEHPALHDLWVEGHGVGMLVASALILLPWAVVRATGSDTGELRQLGCAASVCALTWTAAVPVLDEGLTAISLVAAAATTGWALVSAAAPPRWYAVPRVPMAGSALVLLPALLGLTATALASLFSVAEPFTAAASVRLDPATPPAHPLLLPLGVAVVVLAAALTLPRTRPVRWASGGALVGTAVLTAALYPLPLWVFVVVLGPLGIAVALPSAVLTLLVLAEIVLVAAALLVRRVEAAELVAGAVLPVAAAAFLWTGGHVLEVPFEVRSLVTLVVLALLAIAMPRLETEVLAATAVAVSSVAGVTAAADPSVSLAIHLTLAGAAVTTTALVHRDHRELAWLGGLLLAAATWVRLHDVGVQTPEAYTLPTAVALLAVGVHRLLRDFDATTTSTLLPGLALATVPSLLWVLVDPVSLRAALLGVGCLVLLLGGAALRWSAPVVVGGLVGATLVLRELAPYAAQTPQWVLIGAAGTVLVGAGVTWEARLRDLRQVAGYLGRLR